MPRAMPIAAGPTGRHGLLPEERATCEDSLNASTTRDGTMIENYDKLW